jgi:hypothetical protein
MRILLSAILVIGLFGMGCSDGNSGGSVVPCATRFCACSDGVTVEDTATGLLWERKTTTGDVHDVTNTYSWTRTGRAPDGTAFNVFLAGLNGASFAGHSNWRLPIISEFQSILIGPGVIFRATPSSPIDTGSGLNRTGQARACAGPPCIDPGFAAVGGPTASDYWSALSGTINTAWGADFNNGTVTTNFNKFQKTNDNFVRAVRTGSCSS